MWMVDTPERRSGLASAAEREEGGMLQTGTWVLPADESALDREKITARFDSRIFFYNFTCDQGEGEPVIWLQELFVIKRVHRCGISSNSREKRKKCRAIFLFMNLIQGFTTRSGAGPKEAGWSWRSLIFG